MAYSTKLSIAIHILLAIVRFGDEERQTSTALASSIQINPVIVRNLLQKLKAAGLVQVDKGVGGARLLKTPEEISLYDIFLAVEERQELFKQHDTPSLNCPLGQQIEGLIRPDFEDLENQLHQHLTEKTLQQLVNRMGQTRS